MAVRQLRRLSPLIDQSLHGRMTAQTLHSVYWRRYVDAIPASLIIDDEGNLLGALGRGGARLVYGFASDRAFSDRFATMFEKLLPRIRRELAAETVRLRLEHAPSRALVEPLLKRLWFKPARDWIEFALARGTKLPASPVPSGIRLREGSVDDAEEMVRLDRAAFPDTPILLEDMRARIAEGEQLLIAMRGKAMAGFCLFSEPEPGEGYISVLAVDEEHRGRGIGALLTARACKRLFSGGAQRVRLATDDNNGEAIRLYVRLGFKQSAAGRDYTRPTDPRVIEQMQKQGEGIVIRFGGWR